jgi:hypothetical protein
MLQLCLQYIASNGGLISEWTEKSATEPVVAKFDVRCLQFVEGIKENHEKSVRVAISFGRDSNRAHPLELTCYSLSVYSKLNL